MVFLFITAFLIYVFTQISGGGIKWGDKISLLSFTKIGGSPRLIISSNIPKSQPQPQTNPSFQPTATQEKQVPIPPNGFTVSQLSPYYGMVKINSVRPQYSWTDPSEFTLSSNYANTNLVDITGWRLASNKGAYAAIIPQGVADYNPTGPFLDGDIILESGNTVYVSSIKSPISKNFRLNKCTGYLNEQYSFNPSIQSNCPSLYNRNEISQFNGKCQSFILSQYGCHTPTPDEINLAAGYQDSACRAFLDRFNFNSCYSAHRGDSDFFLREWRIWLGGVSIPFDPQHDRILLLDTKGLLVDQYIY